MSSKIRIVFLAFGVAVYLSVPFIFAGETLDGDKDPNKPMQPKSISWEEFKDRCQEPGKYPDQHAPLNIKVDCTDVQLTYESAEPGSVSLPSARKVSTVISSDKFSVDVQAKDVSVPGKGGTCFRFKEVEKSITVEKSLSCAEVLGIKGSLEDLCIFALDGAKDKNPKLVNVKDTGKVIDTCTGVSGTEPGKGGGK